MYWPNCCKGSTCDYFQPDSPCKSFPKCRFKERYMFVLPNCRSGEQCGDDNWVYEHATDRKNCFPIVSPKQQTICKFHPTWMNPDCRYFQPTKCKLSCSNPDCKYVHVPEAFTRGTSSMFCDS